jgi:hypothetical protein
MNPDLLPVLNLRRQAAAAGWQLTARRTGKDTVFRYERDDDLDGGYIHIRAGWWNGPADYCPARIAVNTPDGFLVMENVTAVQMVWIVRALFGWDADVDAVWPPRPQPPIRDRQALALLGGGVR